MDARVRVKGVCGAIFNDKRQLIGLRLSVSDMGFLKVEQPGPDPFALPSTEISKLQQFGPGHLLEHRVKVTATLIYQRAAEAVYLQSGEEGIVIRTPSTLQLKPGAVVEAAGFIVPGRCIRTRRTIPSPGRKQGRRWSCDRADDQLRRKTHRDACDRDGYKS